MLPSTLRDCLFFVKLRMIPAAGAAFLLMAGTVAIVRAAWLGTVGEETSGTVSDFDCTKRRGKRNRCSRVITFYTHDGRRIDFKDGGRGDIRETIGSRVDTIIYDPDSPQDAMVYEHQNAVLLPGLLLVAGVVLGAMSFRGSTEA